MSLFDGFRFLEFYVQVILYTIIFISFSLVIWMVPENIVDANRTLDLSVPIDFYYW